MTAVRRPRRAMILAAGFGTRLKPLTDERPKPLMEVMGETLLAHAFDNAVRAGAEIVVVNTHHLREGVEAETHRLGKKYGVDVALTHEPVILGTGGGIKGMRAALPDFDGPIYIQNADALIDLDVDALVARHTLSAAAATLVLKKTDDQARYGVIGVDDDGHIADFVGRVPITRSIVDAGMFCGVHLVEETVFSVLDASREMCINKEGYPALLRGGHTLSSYFHDGWFWDVGTPLRLLDANLSVLDGRTPFRHLGTARVDADLVCRTGTLLVQPNAVVDIASGELSRVVIGRGAVVGNGAHLTDVVVLSGASVDAGERIERTIVGTTTRAAISD